MEAKFLTWCILFGIWAAHRKFLQKRMDNGFDLQGSSGFAVVCIITLVIGAKVSLTGPSVQKVIAAIAPTFRPLILPVNWNCIRDRYMFAKVVLSILLIVRMIGFAHAQDITAFENDYCTMTPQAQDRQGLFYLPNQIEPFTGTNTCVFPNGQLHSKGEIVDGLREGMWTWWFENGETRAHGIMEKGGMVGGWLITTGELKMWTIFTGRNQATTRINVDPFENPIVKVDSD